MTRRQPLWFFIDAVAQLRVFASFVQFAIASHFAFARARAHNGNNRLLAPDVPWLSALLATAEADLAWALARRAATIAGLDPDRVARVDLSPAETRCTLRTRANIYCRRFFDFELIARKMAVRLKAAPVFSIPPAAHVEFTPTCQPGPCERDGMSAFAVCVIAPGHAQARAPPLPATCNFS